MYYVLLHAAHKHKNKKSDNEHGPHPGAVAVLYFEVIIASCIIHIHQAVLANGQGPSEENKSDTGVLPASNTHPPTFFFLFLCTMPRQKAHRR
jgi:hypothetical protein